MVCAQRLKTLLTADVLQIRAEIHQQGGLALPAEGEVGHLESCWPTTTADGRLLVAFIAW